MALDGLKDYLFDPAFGGLFQEIKDIGVVPNGRNDKYFSMCYRLYDEARGRVKVRPKYSYHKNTLGKTITIIFGT